MVVKVGMYGFMKLFVLEIVCKGVMVNMVLFGYFVMKMVIVIL